jgi:hypothetical protein
MHQARAPHPASDRSRSAVDRNDSQGDQCPFAQDIDGPSEPTARAKDYLRKMPESSWQVWRERDHVDLTDRQAVAADLAVHMRDFIEMRDVSPALVGHIEHLLDTFEDTDWQDELVVPVASYEPWGGDDPEHLYTASQLGRLLRWALPFVEREAAGGSAEQPDQPA